MPGAEWLALRCKHIPDRYEHLIRYVGGYSNRGRGARTAKAPTPAGESATEPISEFVQRAKQAWARLIRKVYEGERLVLPRACACLNRVMGCRICHHVDWSRPDAPHERDRDAEIRA